MSDLNLNQIQTRLNELFVSYGERKLIFWFDSNKEFEEEIDKGAIILENAAIKKMEPHTQFLTKYFLEVEDKENNYLVYAPFKCMNDDDENNHLLSILKYSTLFNADRTSLMMTQLNIPAELYDVIKRYNKFFSAKSRVVLFEKIVSSDITTKEEIEMALMSVLTKANTAQFYSVIQALFVEHANGSNKLYSLIENYELKDVFWSYVTKYYGYNADEPSIQKLIISFFVNTFFGQLGYQQLPVSLKEYDVLEQTTAIISFMDGVMNDSRYTESIEKLSEDTYLLIGGDKIFEKISIEELINTDIFENGHQKLVMYYIRQLVSGDTAAIISGTTLSDVITKKERAHFGAKYVHHYQAIFNAQQLLSSGFQLNSTQFSAVVKDYEEYLYKLDYYYRKFIWHLDRIENGAGFAELEAIIEKCYRAFLDELSQLWSDTLDFQERPSMLDFYDKFAKSKIKTVVIISDALRYEVAKEIQVVLKKEKKYTTKMSTVFSVLPSVTEFGKAASLRSGNESYIYFEDTDIRVNNIKTNGTPNRNKVLKEKNPNSLAITYADVIGRENAKELRELFNGQEIIYLYHDQIDKTGDHGQESFVFDAVERTINELLLLIQRVSNGANVYRFIITSDHGFIYTRSKVEEYQKIENPSIDEKDRLERRFIISNHCYNEIGISHLRLGDILRNNDNRIIHFPKTSSIFKKAGGGQNYVHGGAAPQEMVVPVLEISVARGSSIKEPVQIQLMTAKRKVIGLSVALEFYQIKAISDTVMKAEYSLYFEDEYRKRISTEHLYYVDATSTIASERFTTFTFEFINRSYGLDEKVYLVIKDNETQIEHERIEFIVDNPFAGDFGFDF